MKNAANRLSAAANYDKINYGEMRFGAAQKNIMEVNDMKKIAAGLLALAIVFGAAADGAFLDSSAIAASAAAYTEDELKAKVQEGVEYELRNWLYDDFDGDGQKEGFALFNEYTDAQIGYNSVARYISNDGVVTEFYNVQSRIAPINLETVVCDGRNFAKLTVGGAGTSSDSIYTVVDGKPTDVKIDIIPNFSAYEAHLNNEDGELYVKFYERHTGSDTYGPFALTYDADNIKLTAKSGSTSKEDELKDNLLWYAETTLEKEWKISKWIYDDFDGDGEKEAVAVLLSDDSYGQFSCAYYIKGEDMELLLAPPSSNQMNDVEVLEGDGTDELKSVICLRGYHWGHAISYVYNVWGDGRLVSTKIQTLKDGEYEEVPAFNGRFTKEDDTFYFYLANFVNSSADGTYEKLQLDYDYNSSSYIVVDGSTPDPVTTDYTYTENEDGTVTITSYTGDAEELVIPDKIDGKTVSAIDSGIFSPLNGGNKTIKKITVPGSVKTIGEEAFACADALEEVYIEDGVTEIGNAAFASCINLKKITIPKSVTKIGDYAFSYAYRSDSSAFIDVTIYCYKDSTAHKYALGENALNHEFSYVLLDEVSNPDPSSDSTVSADPSSAESGSSSGSTSTSTSSAAASSSGDKTSNPATGVAAGVSIAAVLAGGIIMVTKKTKK